MGSIFKDNYQVVLDTLILVIAFIYAILSVYEQLTAVIWLKNVDSDI